MQKRSNFFHLVFQKL